MEAQNCAEARAGEERDTVEREHLTTVQKTTRRAVIDQAKDAKSRHKALLNELADDILGLEHSAAKAAREPPPAERQRKRKPTDRPRRRRSRDGPG
ncbi:MAG: hypothetical protein AAFR17_18560 [Pseudomonadota bacterium]